MVSDDQDVFRVVVVKKRQVKNPEYKQAREPGEPYHPYWIFTDETHEVAFGPYNTLGSARSIRTRKAWDTYNSEPAPGVVEARIEKAVTKWEAVE